MEFAFEESGVVLFDRVLNGVVLRIESLDEHAAGKIAAAGPACDLREELEGALGRAKVRHVQRTIGADDTDHCDAMEVVTFGEHLRADQNVERTCGKSTQGFLILAFAAGCIAIEASDAGFGKFFAQALFELFGTLAKKINILRIALGTFFRNGLRVAAVVALEAVAVLVVRKADTAIGALDGCAAAAADDGPGVGAAVGKDKGLRAEREAFFDALV